MTDPAVKIASAFCVILAGVCASTLFRHNAPVPAAAQNAPAPAAIQVQQPEKKPTAASFGDNSNANAIGASLDTSVLKPIRPAASDPFLDERAAMPTARQELPTASLASNEGFRIHRIVDGDSLESLAEHYLGFFRPCR